MAIISPTTLTPLITPDAAVPPNLLSSSLELAARSSSEVPAAPNCSASSCAACLQRGDDLVAGVDRARRPRCTRPRRPPRPRRHRSAPRPATGCTLSCTSRRCNGPSSAVPSSASSTGVTAVWSDDDQPDADRDHSGHQQLRPRTRRRHARQRSSGRRVCTVPTRSRARDPRPAHRGRAGDAPSGAAPAPQCGGARLTRHPRAEPGGLRPALVTSRARPGSCPSRPSWKSSNACWSSARVFMTNGP